MSDPRRSGLRSVLGVLATVLALVATLLAASVPASAAPATPFGLTDSVADRTTVILSWDRVPGATSYDVEVSTNGFTSALWSLRTVNSQAVPTVALPTGDIAWRVRANDASGSSGWAGGSFNTSAVDGPALAVGSVGDEFTQPTEPVVLSWSPVAGAQTYTIQIGSSSDFADGVTEVSRLQSTTWANAVPAPARDYYWRVKAVLAAGIESAWSETGSYRLTALPPAELTDPILDEVVEDSILDWSPIPGAATYDVDVSPDQEFSEIVFSARNVKGTSVAYPRTLPNDQYWWRVRGRDTYGNFQDWGTYQTGSTSAVGRFQRKWSQQPGLEYPADGAVVTKPFFFQWSPASLASSYRIELSTDRNFPTGGVSTCSTALTTLTPDVKDLNFSKCMPQPGLRYYWRVVGVDSFTTAGTDPVTEIVSADVFSFTYDPALVQQTAPANGAVVTVPTLRWQPYSGADTYRVRIYRTDQASAVVSADVATTTFTPRKALPVLPAGVSYTWDVQWLTRNGQLAPARTTRWAFTVAPQPAPTATALSLLAPLGQASARFPLLRWTPVVGASSYRVGLRTSGSTTWTAVTTTTPYPEWQDWTTTWSSPGDYQWMVTGLDANGVQMATSTVGEFTIATPDQVTGHRTALRATMFGDPAQYCDPAEECLVGQTPVFRWAPVADASFYRLWFALDKDMTTPFATADVIDTTFSPRDAWPDNTAGVGYHWLAVACTAVSTCPSSAPEQASDAFSKVGVAVDGNSPGVPYDASGQPTATAPVVSDDVTLRWNGYLATTTATNTDSYSIPTQPRVEARYYQVQVSTTPSFQTGTILDDQELDQRSWTTWKTTYPEGLVYWRVRALDGNRNALPWSTALVFRKKSPTPVLRPDPAGPVSGDHVMSWNPTNFAGSYDVEVYGNADRNASSGNKRASGTSLRQVAFSSPRTLSPDTYVWRVRRKDAEGRPGAWSAWGQFTVATPAPTLLSPDPDAVVPPRDGLFTWEATTGAVSYRYEWRTVGSTTISQQKTVARAWAPPRAFAEGDYEWRVLALDMTGAPMSSASTTAWRAFRVNGSPVATTAARISGTGVVDTTLVLDPGTPQWNLPVDSQAYQWFKDGRAISGETGTSYDVRPTDVNARITVRVTGTLDGYADGVSESNAITVAAGPPPTAVSSAVLSGDPTYDSVLTVTPPVWNEPNVVNHYEWLRNGTVIPNQVRSSYRVTLADVGQQIAVRVIGRRPGYADATSVTAPLTIKAIASTTRATLVTSTIKRGTRGKITVVVSAPGVRTPTGLIRIKRGTKVIKKVSLLAEHAGTRTIRLPKLSKGKHRLRAFYGGNAIVTKSRSKRVVLTVV